MDLDEVSSRIVDMVNSREALAVDGLTSVCLVDDSSEPAYAVGFWDRHTRDERLMVGVFTLGGLRELQEEVNSLVARASL